MIDTILHKHEVLAKIGISHSTLWQWRRAGIFPQPLQLGPQAIGWRESEIQAWLDSREIASIAT